MLLKFDYSIMLNEIFYKFSIKYINRREIMTSNHLKKASVFILIIGILCTCLFGCTDKPASGNDVNSTTESTTKGEESTTLGGDSDEEESSSAHKEKSPVKKDDETTTNKKTNVKESSTKKVDKETTTKGTTTTEPTTEAYIPTPLVPLTTEQELKIKQDYLEYRRNEVKNTKNDGEYDNLIVDDVMLENYFGTYNDCYVMLIELNCDILLDGYRSEYVAGYRFDYVCGTTTMVYRNGEFTAMRDAYSEGLLSEKDIKDIHYYHTTEYFVIEY